MLITTSRKSTKKERCFARSLSNLFNSTYISRGKHSLSSLEELASLYSEDIVLIVSKNKLSFFKNYSYLASLPYSLLENKPIRQKFLSIENKAKENPLLPYVSFSSPSDLQMHQKNNIFFFTYLNKKLPLSFSLISSSDYPFVLKIHLPKKIYPEIFLEHINKSFGRSKTIISKNAIEIYAKDKTALRAATTPLLKQISLFYSL